MRKWMAATGLAAIGAVALFAIVRGQGGGEADLRTIQAKGFEATTPGNVKVRFVGISDEANSNDDSRRLTDHAWTPSGLPFEATADPDGYSGQRFSVFPQENARTRYLIFEITAPGSTDIDTAGYIPGSPKTGDDPYRRAGFDLENQNRAFPRRAYERFPVMLPQGKSDKYRYGIASGPWKVLANLKITLPREKSGELGSGPWGSIRMIGTDEMSRNQGIAGAKMVMPYVTFKIDAPAPRRFSLRIKHFDKIGDLVGQGEIAHGLSRRNGLPEFNVDHITVEGREYSWVEFDDVHFDPDLSNWPPAYWGKEGERAVVRDGATGMELRGVVRNRLFDGSWRPAGNFAPDGKQWRDFPYWRNSEYGALADIPAYKNSMVAVMSLFDRLPPTTLARLDVVESKSATPGKDLGKVIAGSFAHGAGRSPVQTVIFQRPAGAKYVQVRARVPSGQWRKVGEMPVPTAPVRKPDKALLEAFRKGGTVVSTNFMVIVRGTGKVESMYLPEKDGWVTMPKTVDHDSETGPVRIVAVLKSGERKVLKHNAVSDAGDVMYDFDITEDSDSQFRDLKLRLSQIKSFEVQAQRYTIDRYFPLRLP